ncbi:MAG: hypothetical protein HYZ42_00115 [Bacteroidetes bacterium]|nr:hypothetical protein [Bacteroidota bacterium]
MSPWKPFLYFCLVAIGLFFGIWLKPSNSVLSGNSILDEAISLAKSSYVDTINEQQFGIKITNEQVMKLLKGPKGTKVKLGIFRKSKPGLIPFVIIRDKIPIYSVDAGYMIDNKTGYIKISRFAENTYDEFTTKLKKLKSEGLQDLIVDLRGNPGGYLTAATKITDELLPDKKLIVYTEGLHQKKSTYNCEKTGLFESGKLILLIDEGSASASEILSGGIQDWDRGLIIGRRSFGKGLVQEQMQLSDGSGLRLTVARYYTPTGRCIQKPYNKDIEKYENEVYDRFKNGELEKLDSGKITKNKAFKTPAGRTVYDGGGITPDIFIGSDTGGHYRLINTLLQENVLREISVELNDEFKPILKDLKSVKEINQVWPQIEKQAMARVKSEIAKLNLQFKYSQDDLIQVSRYLESLVARFYFNEEGFYFVYNQHDKTVLKAIEIFNSEKDWKLIQSNLEK